MDPRTLEKYSSAFTLSDMEVFIFPELLYALVLANLMSPRIWRWREDPWFAGMSKLGFNRRLQRLKQYIMEHYSFNLDLETWGLTTQRRETERFRDFIDLDMLSRSNALFGYEGDKYYFDLDIRRHFGLDRYGGETIPYWKTETVEAMDAFVHKTGHRRGAGECVSLSALYAAALYLVAEIPLEDIFLLATPLHSQNFIAREEGVLTNNRRLVTRTMWFNGTELSAKARRALEKERVTLVAHLSGVIHSEYPQASIDPQAYLRLTRHLQRFLSTPITFEIFTNFLRAHGEYRGYFQFEYFRDGHRYFIAAEKLFRYEHASPNRVHDATLRKLLEEVEEDDLDLEPDPRRYVLNVLEKQLAGKKLDCRLESTHEEFRQLLDRLPDLPAFCEAIKRFACTQPRLPSPGKNYVSPPPLSLPLGWSRDQIVAYLASRRRDHPVADLAFYAARQIPPEGWMPFLKACLERNPVSLENFASVAPEEVYARLEALPAESIYEESGLATPDEVVNFGRGDGLEKAICLLNVLRPRGAAWESLEVAEGRVRLAAGGREYPFSTKKNYSIRVTPGELELKGLARPG